MSEARADASDFLSDAAFMNELRWQDSIRLRPILEQLLRLTNPAPITEQRLREDCGFTSEPDVVGLIRGKLWAMPGTYGWRIAYEVDGDFQQSYPFPKTIGDVLILIERVEREGK